MSKTYVVVGDERLPFSAEALAACCVADGERVESIETLEKLMRAEHAALNASHAIYRARASSVIGGDK